MTPTDRRGSPAGILFIAATVTGWASVCLFLKYLTHYVDDGWTTNGWRYGISAVMWWPWLIYAGFHRRLPAGLWRAALAPTLFNCCGQVCFAWAPYYIDAGLMGFLLRAALISSTIGAMILFADERMLLRIPAFWAGLIFVIAGSFCTVLLGENPIKGGHAVGIALGITAGLFFGLYAVAVRRWMRGLHAITSFAAVSTYTAVVMCILMLLFGTEHGAVVLRLSPWPLTMLVLSALIGIALCHVLYYAAISRLGVAISSAIVQLAPFLGAAASVWWFGEVLTLWQWRGGLAMLIGALILLYAERRRAGQSRLLTAQSDVRNGETTEDGGQTSDPVYLHGQRLPLSDG